MAESPRLMPGATLGVLGGGQLGRLFVIDALRMGYKAWVLDPDVQSPAGAVASRHLASDYTDTKALEEMGRGCDAITIEFENIPAESVKTLSTMTRVTPSVYCIEIAQDRRAEKSFMAEHGLRVAPFAVIESEADISAAVESVGFPSILKTARLGYDGKGQFVCRNESDIVDGFTAVSGVPCVLERRIDLAMELSVVLARSDAGDLAAFPVAENRHVNGILDTSCVPASCNEALAAKAIEMAGAIADALHYVGVLAVELFVDQQGELLVNEIAPRPHNSGHYTLDATSTSQFEQQVRMLCNLPAGSTRLQTSVVMLNLLGDRWIPDDPDWNVLYQNTESKLHLYGKAAARAGRKMGHINVLGKDMATIQAEIGRLQRSL